MSHSAALTGWLPLSRDKTHPAFCRLGLCSSNTLSLHHGETSLTYCLPCFYPSERSPGNKLVEWLPKQVPIDGAPSRKRLGLWSVSAAEGNVAHLKAPLIAKVSPEKRVRGTLSLPPESMGSNSPYSEVTLSASPPSITWENCRPLHFFVRLRGSSNQNRRPSRRTVLGAIGTWTPYLRICVHGQRSTTLLFGFQTRRTPPCGHLHHQCLR